MATRIKTGAVVGIDGYAVTVEVDLSRGLPGFNIVGLPNTAVKESRQRVLAAIRNCGFKFPAGKVTVNLAPAGVRKEGASYDLAIAMGVIVASRERHRDRPPPADGLLLGELSLFGELRPVRGLLPIVLDAVARGERLVIVPGCQAWEARLVKGIEVIGADRLSEVARWWFDGWQPPQRRRPRQLTTTVSRSRITLPGADSCTGLVGPPGQERARRAATIAAAGGHNLLLVGSPGTGKTRLARVLARLQPQLTEAEGLEVTRIHSAAGTLQTEGLIRHRPFRAPHHTITRAGLIGGGNLIRPGEVTLAHCGVLFLDEIAEFQPAVLDALREPLAEGRITLSRSTGYRTYPAAFQLIAAMNPCHCGYLGSQNRTCTCSPAVLARYRSRISGPMLDRIDLFVEMMECATSLKVRQDRAEERIDRPDPVMDDVVHPDGVVHPDWRHQASAEAIATARRRLDHRLAGATPFSEDPGTTIARWGLDESARTFLEQAATGLALSIRGILRCARVACTIAALDGDRKVTARHLAEALEFRLDSLPGFNGSTHADIGR